MMSSKLRNDLKKVKDGVLTLFEPPLVYFWLLLIGVWGGKGLIASITKSFTFNAGDVIKSSDINTNFDQLFTQVNSTMSDVSTLNTSVQAMNPIGFVAIMGNSTINASAFNQVVTTSTPLNTSNAFNTSNATFVAPVAGFYRLDGYVNCPSCNNGSPMNIYMNYNGTTNTANFVNISTVSNMSTTNNPNYQVNLSGNFSKILFLNLNDTVKFLYNNPTANTVNLVPDTIVPSYIKVVKINP